MNFLFIIFAQNMVIFIIGLSKETLKKSFLTSG